MKKMRLLLILVSCLIIHPLNAQSPTLNVFLLSFDNFSHDAEIDWLRAGFVDFISDYLKSNFRINAQRTEKIEQTLNQLKQKPEFKYAKNYILTGSYQRDKEKFIVEIELTDLNNWKSVGSRKVEVVTADFAKIIEAVDKAVAELLNFVQPIPSAEEAAPLATISADSLDKAISQSLASFKATSAATQKFSFAIERLDQKLKEQAPESGKATRPLQYIPQSSSDFARQLVEPLRRSTDFNDILNFIIQNPYEIEISEPFFQRVPLRDDYIRVAFDINYKLRRAVITEMLETIPYRSRNDFETYTEYIFSGDKIVFDAELRTKIARGDYRSFPVITLVNSDGLPIFSIFDIPQTTSRTLPRLLNTQYVNRFTPRFSLSASAWDVKVWLYSNDLKVQYTFELSVAELQNVREITVNILPEKEALQILGINP